MATLRHPVIAGVTQEVTDDQVSEWVAAGWLPNPPSVNKEQSGSSEPGKEK